MIPFPTPTKKNKIHNPTPPPIFRAGSCLCSSFRSFVRVFIVIANHTTTNNKTQPTHCGAFRSAAEELVRSQFSAFRNMPSPGIQLERTFGRQNRHGGSTQSLNKMADPAVPLSGRHASSNSDLAGQMSATPPKPTTTITTITLRGQAQRAAVGPKPAAAQNVPPAAAAAAGQDNVAAPVADAAAAAVAASPTASRSKFAPGNIFKNFFK